MYIPLTGKPVVYKHANGVEYTFRPPDDETLINIVAIEKKYPHDEKGNVLFDGKTSDKCTLAELAGSDYFNEKIDFSLIGMADKKQDLLGNEKPSSKLQIGHKIELLGWYSKHLFGNLEKEDLEG